MHHRVALGVGDGGSRRPGLEQRLDHLVLAVGYGRHERRHAWVVRARAPWATRLQALRGCCRLYGLARRAAAQVPRPARDGIYWAACACAGGSVHADLSDAACARAVDLLQQLGMGGFESHVDLRRVVALDGLEQRRDTLTRRQRQQRESQQRATVPHVRERGRGGELRA